jgi:TPR repeat protein
MSTDKSDLEADGACASFGTNRDLFTLPDSSHLGECPICFLPLPIEQKKWTLMACCCKTICNGCNYANAKREIEAGLQQRCAFCREPAPKSDQEANKLCMKRVKKNDPLAICQMGRRRRNEGDYETAFEYFTKAAELGDAAAHFELACLYHNGRCVEKDTKKDVYYLEEAAIRGHPTARHNLGCDELDNGRYERAKKHWIIAANLGLHDSLKGLRMLYAEGHATKDNYLSALRAYQAAVEATKSAEREKAEEAVQRGEVEIFY